MNLMVEYTSGLGTAIVIPVLLKHNIPEKLEESPKTVDQLSEGTKINPEASKIFISSGVQRLFLI